jgi:hypothetical protein
LLKFTRKQTYATTASLLKTGTKGDRAMRKRKLIKHSEQVIKDVVKHWSKFDSISKECFEEGLDIIIAQIEKKTKIPYKEIEQHTHQVIKEFSTDYQTLPDEIRGGATIISMIYMKYMQKIGQL